MPSSERGRAEAEPAASDHHMTHETGRAPSSAPIARDVEAARWIVLVEDNDDDAFFVERGFAKRIARLRFERFGDTAAAARKLLGEAHTGVAPDLVLIDLNLGGLSGFDLLELLRGTPELMATPALIVSTSMTRRDVVKAYRMRANAYIRKPDDVTGYDSMVDDIVRFWCCRATLIADL